MMRTTALLDAVADCLCVTIDASSVPGVCFCGVIPGDSISLDYAGCTTDDKRGMAWVRMTALYPADGLNVVNETVNNCGASIGMDLEVGIVRPIPGPDSFGNMPSEEAYRASGVLMNDDATVMLKALRCCEALADVDMILGTYTPAGPEGGVVGGTWPLAVIFD